MDTPDEAVQEALSELQDSLKHTIHYLNGILDEIATGSYTPKKASEDYENLLWNEGIDFISQLSSLAELDLEIV